jgi:hypothetical protein
MVRLAVHLPEPNAAPRIPSSFRSAITNSAAAPLLTQVAGGRTFFRKDRPESKVLPHFPKPREVQYDMGNFPFQ